MFVYLSSHNITVEQRIRARITVGKQRGVGVYTQYSTAFGGEALKYQICSIHPCPASAPDWRDAQCAR